MRSAHDQSPPTPPDGGDRYRLNPARLPQRLDLDLDPELLNRLEELAARSGRSISEIAGEILGSLVGDRL